MMSIFTGQFRWSQEILQRIGAEPGLEIVDGEFSPAEWVELVDIHILITVPFAASGRFVRGEKPLGPQRDAKGGSYWWAIADRGSKNGTRVNGISVRGRADLDGGATSGRNLIELGSARFLFWPDSNPSSANGLSDAALPTNGKDLVDPQPMPLLDRLLKLNGKEHFGACARVARCAPRRYSCSPRDAADSARLLAKA
jgi:hypothetical protein